MTLPAALLADLADRVGCPAQRWDPVRGGDIHAAWHVQLADGRRLFVKSSPRTPPGLFAREVEGLRWIGSFGALPVPEVVAWRDSSEGGPGYLALAWIEPGGQRDEAAFGQGLARLHAHAVTRSCWPRSNFIGPLPQANAPCATWAAFWVERRLGLMLTRATPQLDRETLRLVEAAMGAAPDLLRDVTHLGPLHGDLWAGYALDGRDGRTYLIDPAAYVGDPEVDLAMMALFGGFGPGVWQAYFAQRPPARGFEVRRALYQLYPLLVHVALFGAGYVGQVRAAAREVAG